MNPIEYEDIHKKVFIKAISDEKSINILFLKNNEVLIDLNFSKIEGKIIKLTGTIGDQIMNAKIDESIKIERCCEAIENNMIINNKNNIKI